MRHRRLFLLCLLAPAGLALAFWLFRPAAPLVALRAVEVEVIQDQPRGGQGPEQWLVTFELTNISPTVVYLDAGNSCVTAVLANRWVEVDPARIGCAAGIRDRNLFVLVVPQRTRSCRFSLACRSESAADRLEQWLGSKSLDWRVMAGCSWVIQHLPRQWQQTRVEAPLPPAPTRTPPRAPPAQGKPRHTSGPKGG